MIDDLRDMDIRNALHEFLRAFYIHDADTKVIDELGVLRGDVRVDVAVVNGALSGFEIKSDRDSLARLPAQRDAYSLVFDQVTLIVGQTQLAKVESLVPSWWGLACARAGRNGVVLETIRAADLNPAIDPLAVARLLWREELVAIVAEVAPKDAPGRKSREQLCRLLVNAVPLPALCAAVRDAIKARGAWRSGRPRTRGGEKFRPYAKSLHSQVLRHRWRNHQRSDRPN